jgi:hypothetical protein
MSMRLAPPLALCAGLALLQNLPAHAEQPHVDLHVYVNDTCIIADEPFFVPEAKNADGSEQMTPKFLPLIAVLISKFTELLINHEIQGQANQIKTGAARKDTHYALTKAMNLYRADLDGPPALSVNSKLGCMTILAAKLKPDGTDCTKLYIPKELAKESMSLPESQWKTSRTDDSLENQLRRANICVDGNASAAYEARFEFSSDGTAYRLKNAGYRITSLLTTQDKGATRSTFYALKVSEPGATDQQEVLTTASVDLGTVTAGARSPGAGGDKAPWLRTPPLSLEGRRVFDEKTRTQQELYGEIDALKRALARNQRVLGGLDQRIAVADADIAAGLKQERTRVAVQIQAQGAELDARNAEIQELPHAPLEFMPVTIEVSVTETESEKKAQLALADIINTNSDVVASSLGNSASGLLSKSVNPTDLKLDDPAPDARDQMEHARARYFDAVVAVDTAPDGAASQDDRQKLQLAKNEYNDARHALGLEPIQ